MGRCLAVALLGVGMMSLSCNRTALPARQASAAPDAAIATDSSDSADASQLGGLESRFETLATRLAPSVVAVSASTQVLDSDDLLRCEDLNPEKLEAMLDRTTRMVGTGLIIDPDGYILTNEHVIGEAENVWVTADDGKVYPALVVGTDPRSDLAVLKIPARNLKPVTFAPADTTLSRGQWAIALGNPYGLAASGNQAMAVGIISALDRALPKLSKKENRLYSGLIQTTCPINPGNSGGPLFDLYGRVIGINTAVILPEKKTNGIGFAMPITRQFLSAVEDLKSGREVVYSYLGVSVTTPTSRQRRSAGVEDDQGVKVESIDRDSPAQGLIKEEDLLVKVNDEAVHDAEQFVRIVGRIGVDQPAKLTVQRGGESRTISCTLQRRVPTAAAITRDSRRMRWEGLLVGPVPANWSGKSGEKADKGLVVLAVHSRSKFASQGVHEGDVITAVAGKAVADVMELQKLVNDLPAEQKNLTLAGHKGAVMASSRD